MKDVLYVGPYRQNDEWGYTAKAFATLLAAQKINLVLRPVWFTGEVNALDIEAIEKYEQNELSTNDILIQHGLPSYINYNGHFKTNIAVLSVDSRLDNTEWKYHLDLMDKVIVFSAYEKSLLEQSGIDPDKIYHFDFPPVILNNKIQNLNLSLPGTVFYTTGSLGSRSGLLEILSAYLSGFNINDPVNLIVCSNNSDEVQQKVAELKGSLGIYSRGEYYPNVVVINSMDPGVLNYVHKMGHFYINATYNAIPNQTLMRAILNNSYPIVPEHLELFKGENRLAIKTHQDICVCSDRPVHGLWSGEFTWSRPDTVNLMQHMREAAKEGLSDYQLQQLAAFKQQIFTAPNDRITNILCTP